MFPWAPGRRDAHDDLAGTGPRVGQLLEAHDPGVAHFVHANGLHASHPLRPAGGRLTAPQPLAVGPEAPVEAVAACAGLGAADLVTRNHPPLVVSVGLPFVVAEVTGREALAGSRPVAEPFARLGLPAEGAHLYARTVDGVDARCRVFAPLHAVPEDSATGSANAALAAFLASLSPARDLVLSLRIAQGVEMGRPSLLEASAEKAGGVVRSASVGGRCVPVMEGTLRLPGA